MMSQLKKYMSKYVTIYKCVLIMSQLKKYRSKCDNLQMCANDAPTSKVNV